MDSSVGHLWKWLMVLVSVAHTCCAASQGRTAGYCRTPPDIANGWVELDRNYGDMEEARPEISAENDNFEQARIEIRWRPDDVILYRCKSTHKLVGGSRRRICKTDGGWTGIQPQCLPKMPAPSGCRNPTRPDGGSVLPRGKIRWQTGDVYTVACDDGYVAPPRNRATCLGDGSWSPATLYCNRSPKTCRTPTVRNGRVLPPWKSSWFEGDVFSVRCYSGHRPPFMNRATCTRGGYWSPPSLICEGYSSDYCPPPSEIKNGHLEIDRNTGESQHRGRPGHALQSFPGQSSPWVPRIAVRWVENDVVIYKCNGGYKLVGSERRVCTSNGDWTGVKPSCREYSEYCSPPSEIENGHLEIDRNTESQHYGRPGPVFQSSTGQTSRWRSRIAVRWVKNDAVIYKCERGYKLVGSGRRVCTSSGDWTGVEPSCKAESTNRYCPTLRPISNGHLVMDRNVGDDDDVPEAQYNSPGQSYSQRYELRRISPAIQHSPVPSLTVRWVKDDVIVYECNEGFRLVGDSRRVCTSAGTWTGEQPNCENGMAGRSALLPEDGESASEALVVVPVENLPNGTTGMTLLKGNVCQPNPCLHGCVCEESVMHDYHCKRTGSANYFGPNCEYESPRISCEHDAIEIYISSDLFKGLDKERANGVVYLAPSDEAAKDLSSIDKSCRFAQSPSDKDSLQLFVPFPFHGCGTVVDNSTKERMIFSNTIWFNRAGQGISAHSTVADITCAYQDIYRVTTALDAMCCPTPPLVTSRGVFKFEATMWADPPGADGGRTRLRLDERGSLTYKAGEMLYLKVEMKADRGTGRSMMPSLQTCWLSRSMTTPNPLPGRDLLLYPARVNSSVVSTFGPTNTPMAVHFGFQLMRATKSSTVYLHCQIKVMSKRTKRSLSTKSLTEEFAVLTKGPIIFIAPPERNQVTDRSREMGHGYKDQIIMAVSIFGAFLLLVMFACCIAHLRVVHARGRRVLDEEGSPPPMEQRRFVNAVHPL